MRRTLTVGGVLQCSILTVMLGAAATGSVIARQGVTPATSADAERISINDNRKAAGTLNGNVLTVRLEARIGQWHPDKESDPGITVKAFAIEGGRLEIPGPMIRVVEGTEVRAIVRNRLDADPLAVHGLYSRPGKAGAPGTVESIAPGDTREFRFVAGSPGTYYYWAASRPDTPLNQRLGVDSQLSGAFIVEPRGAAAIPDRVLLMGNWNKLPLGTQPQPDNRTRFVINGRSWPNTERLDYRVGDVVRMRLINAGANVHPMHLHGFYFNVDSRGTEFADTIFPPTGSARMVVTERLASDRTFSLTWKPTRPGNWLFHCHDNVHLEHGGAIDSIGQRQRQAPHHVENHAMEMMAGPVMGITVTGRSLERVEAPNVKRRQLRLIARVDADSTEDEPFYGYTLEEGPGPAQLPPTPYLPGPTILLKRGEPVSIAVVNRLPEPTAVHWHGIELESYYDGVAGYSGEGKRIAPAIKPGESFEARFTPPRSGTFIYHTHVDEVRQQQAGLSGPLVVVDDPALYDAEHNVVLAITAPRKRADGAVVLLNGTSKPEQRIFRKGERYRLRFINVHIARPSMFMRVSRGSSLLTWKGVAKDGRDLPPDQSVEQPSEIQMGNGETYDFEFMAQEPGDIRLDVAANNGVVLVTMPIRIQ
jgi:FtsP/CotA-like multicopper oxidase with cupredoxin domain